MRVETRIAGMMFAIMIVVLAYPIAAAVWLFSIIAGSEFIEAACLAGRAGVGISGTGVAILTITLILNRFSKG